MAAPRSTLQAVPGPAKPTPAGRPTPSNGEQLRTIVQKAVAQRKHLLRINKSRMPAVVMNPFVMKLEQWLIQNPHPSNHTVRNSKNLAADIRLVMPSTRGGLALLTVLEDIIATA